MKAFRFREAFFVEYLIRNQSRVVPNHPEPVPNHSQVVQKRDVGHPPPAYLCSQYRPHRHVP